ncbi:MAG TPA: cation:proton antiporter [Candidatus Eisenbacteria bacterium]|nr:cation:proton antiporter [Candidatus Eisenbacteria bacterium]
MVVNRFPVLWLLAGAVALGAALPRPAWAAAATDPVVPVLLHLSIVLAAAKLGGWIAVRVKQPAVLGELLAGVAIGNVVLLGYTGFEGIRTDPILAILASLGVILLLFEVGLESTVRQMVQVGGSALLVAVLGVVTPFALGWAAGAWLLPDRPAYVHAFLGAVLTATSVGITARVLHDIGATRTKEAKIILGAAVIDDVLGLVILAVVSGVITAADRGGPGLSALEIGWITLKALGFLTAAIFLGVLLAPRLVRLASKIRVRGILLTTGLIACFLLSYLAARADLAPIVGAFAAGLILEGSHFSAFEESRESSIESLLHPISTFLVPIFFVLTGVRVELEAFADMRILGLAAVLTIAGWIGKQACSLGVLQRGVDRLTVGIGMVPRGEVGLIFANIGMTLSVGGESVITAATYSAVVIMVMVTTLVTPPLLQWSIRRRERRDGDTAGRAKPRGGSREKARASGS